MSSEDPTLVRTLALVATGVVLMFIAHFLGFMALAATEGAGMRPPYWWAYLVLYPLAGMVAVRIFAIRWAQASLGLCAAPVLYFLGLGLFAARWSASQSALVGSLVALALTAFVTFIAQPRMAKVVTERG